MKPLTLNRQHDQINCSPTCIGMIAKHHGRSYSMDTLRRKSGINREGVSDGGGKHEGITEAPITFITGYELPFAYRVKDLVALIPGRQLHLVIRMV